MTHDPFPPLTPQEELDRDEWSSLGRDSRFLPGAALIVALILGVAFWIALATAVLSSPCAVIPGDVDPGWTCPDSSGRDYYDADPVDLDPVVPRPIIPKPIIPPAERPDGREPGTRPGAVGK